MIRMGTLNEGKKERQVQYIRREGNSAPKNVRLLIDLKRLKK
jgi:hypothetical protein